MCKQDDRGVVVGEHANGAAPDRLAREVDAHAYDALANMEAHWFFLLMGAQVAPNRGYSLSPVWREGASALLRGG